MASSQDYHNRLAEADGIATSHEWYPTLPADCPGHLLDVGSVGGRFLKRAIGCESSCATLTCATLTCATLIRIIGDLLKDAGIDQKVLAETLLGSGARISGACATRHEQWIAGCELWVTIQPWTAGTG